MNKNSGNVLVKSTMTSSESTQFRNPRVFLWIALIAGMLFAARHFGSGPLRELLQWISGLGSTAPLVFVPLYIVACVLFIPGSVLTLRAGFVERQHTLGRARCLELRQGDAEEADPA